MYTMTLFVCDRVCCDFFFFKTNNSSPIRGPFCSLIYMTKKKNNKNASIAIIPLNFCTDIVSAHNILLYCVCNVSDRGMSAHVIVFPTRLRLLFS